jgi:hypothetical protein
LQFEILNQMDAQIANIFAGASQLFQGLIPIRSPQPHEDPHELTLGLALDAQKVSTVYIVAH